MITDIYLKERLYHATQQTYLDPHFRNYSVDELLGIVYSDNRDYLCMETMPLLIANNAGISTYDMVVLCKTTYKFYKFTWGMNTNDCDPPLEDNEIACWQVTPLSKYVTTWEKVV